MTTIFLRSVKGSPLSTAEVDSNFSNLNVDKLEISEAVVSNIPNKVVKRDSAGNFSAGIITANLNGSLLGVPTAPTPLAGTNSTQIATTAFVIGERSNAATLTNKTITFGDNSISGTSAQLAAAISDETGSGPLVFADSPVLSGVPTAPTAATGTNTTQIATTAFVQSAVPVLSVAGKTGTVLLTKADVGLANVDNTSDANKPVSTAQQAAINAAVPAGAVLYFAMATEPTGWLKANGAAVSRTTYAALFAAIGTRYGAGNGSTTFNLPDLRGEFLRGFDDGRGIDSGRAIGTWQDSDNKRHTHDVNGYTNVNSGFPSVFFDDSGGDSPRTLISEPSGGTESRPRNIAMLACIKY